MLINVKLFATLRTGREKQMLMEFNESATPKLVLRKLQIPEKEVAILFVNGMDAKFTHELKDGDTVSIFPPVGGG